LANKLIEISTSVSDKIENYTKIFCGFLTIIMTSTVMIGVFYRYILHRPLRWTGELAIYCMIWIGFLSMSVAYKYRKHPKLDLMVNLLPYSLKLIIKILIEILVAIFLIILIEEGIYYSIRGFTRQTESLKISMFIPYLSVVAGAILTLIQQMLTITCLFKEKEGDE
jgi:TRAP-type C4-dicarboxylate transport system permease small subunit